MYHHHTHQSLQHTGSSRDFFTSSISLRCISRLVPQLTQSLLALFNLDVLLLFKMYYILSSLHTHTHIHRHTLTHMHIHTHTHSAKQFREALSKKHEMDCGLAMIIKQRAKVRTYALPHVQHTLPLNHVHPLIIFRSLHSLPPHPIPDNSSSFSSISLFSYLRPMRLNGWI